MQADYFFLFEPKIVMYGASALINQVRLRILNCNVFLPFGEKQGSFQISCKVDRNEVVIGARVGRVGGIPVVPVHIDISEHDDLIADLQVNGRASIGQVIQDPSVINWLLRGLWITVEDIQENDQTVSWPVMPNMSQPDPVLKVASSTIFLDIAKQRSYDAVEAVYKAGILKPTRMRRLTVDFVRVLGASHLCVVGDMNSQTTADLPLVSALEHQGNRYTLTIEHCGRIAHEGFGRNLAVYEEDKRLRWNAVSRRQQRNELAARRNTISPIKDDQIS